ncbi:MAG TPA: polysaccharide pyruvyl transferase family protein [Actinomycetaceae bacterium]|nr:polysaccharide pyruvyl transferase family protein [Actinomycetaceae bacterium]
MRVAIEVDIGQSAYHVGDEAIAHGAVYQLGRRGITDIVLLTRDPEQTRSLHPETDVAHTLRFPWSPADRERYLNEIKRVMAGERSALPADDQVFGVIETIRGVDALFIAGGGNMNSRYGWLLYERAALAHIAVALGKQIVIGGQTLGPELSPADAGTLRNLLRNASLVGLREDHSLRLARKLAPGHGGLRPCFDDAAELPLAGLARGRAVADVIAATFSPPSGSSDRDETAITCARVLGVAAARFSVPVHFVPHVSTPARSDADAEFHRAVGKAMTAEFVFRQIRPALETAAATYAARAVVTSRYHPVVFACAVGIPVIAIAPDEYSRVRMEGCLARFGIDLHVPLTGEVTSDAAIEQLVTACIESARPASFLAAHTAWWDSIAAALASTDERRRKLVRHFLRSRRHDANRLRARFGRTQAAR